MILLLLLSACDPVGDELDLEHPDDKLVAEKLVIWWDEGYGPPYQSFAGDALNDQFKETHFEFHPFSPPSISDDSQDSLFSMMRSEPSPDLIIFDSRYLSIMTDAEYLGPIPDMYGLEMDSDIVSGIRTVSSDLSLYALPFGRVVEGLFYNKGFFDELQLPYPTDGMTWDEVTKLAQHFKDMSLNPLHIANLHQPASQLMFNIYDLDNKNFYMKDPEWNLMVEFLLEVNGLDAKTDLRTASSFGAGNSAMVAGPLFGEDGLHRYQSNLSLFNVDWDVVSYPLFEMNGDLPAEQMLVIGVPVRTENKDDAYKVLNLNFESPS